jgi:drug/metabolite transporter (DMT)-like permease
MTIIASEPRRQLDAAVTAIQIGASVVVGFVALIFFTLGDGSRSPDAVTWRAAVTVVIVGCLISGLIHTIQAIGQSRRRDLAHVSAVEAQDEPSVTMASPALSR